MDAIGDKRKQLYQGKEYDYVFDVDIGEGVPALKLPYNLTGRWRKHCLVHSMSNGCVIIII